MSQQGFYNQGLGFSFDVSGNLARQSSFSQPLLSSQSGASLPGVDLNSPEVFRQNIQLIQTQVSQVQELARSALSGIEHAYHPGSNPVHTAAVIGTLKQTLQDLVEALRQSGVGALPLEPPLGAEARTEEQLLADAGRAVQALYERQRRIQEGAGVVANLLGAPEVLAGSQGARR
ncbi:uncharacterized protein TRAVEDRAFT_129656 [Trametes versicolor FP-101664 SS1]|uniref:uncharacterized protein n=1 Tax=Trametes versicolor (strain FP-101664) TaxID=717944 RepID=UPI0004622913|nr:uncharacterized protein TRAVEDRAFT_129656 [Trametes versicolor FP-101664 SS1]EIW56231.1 hypothetical protein TRAVEDRAFT_129656 [Trametes versicolor FP-101664 SS1]